MDIRRELEAGGRALGISLTSNQIALLESYLGLLIKWNSTFNLVGTSDQAELVQKHLLDSISIASYVKHSPVLDVGSGAGLPGIPLAITLPELSFTLLDANGKKTRFMRQALIELNLSNIQVIQSRVEKYKPIDLPKTVLARAFAPVDKALTVLAEVCASSGQILIMLGDRVVQLPQDLGLEKLATQIIPIPSLSSQRHLLIADKK